MTKPIERATRPPKAGVREAPFKLRDTTGPNDGSTLDGYGAVFLSESVINGFEGRFREVIAPGSMARSFRERPPIVQFDHGQHNLIGSLPIAKLISAAEEIDPVLAPNGGAHIVARMLDDWLFSPIRAAIAAGAISGMSFRFEVIRESWNYASGEPIKDDMSLIRELERTWDGSVPDEDLPLRTLRELKVPEIGPVTWPAYSETSVMVRGGTIDLDRLNEPKQRELLARALFTLDSDVRESVARGVVDPDDGLRAVRGMLLDAAARRVQVSRQPDVGIDDAAQTVRGMLQDIEARKMRVERHPS